MELRFYANAAPVGRRIIQNALQEPALAASHLRRPSFHMPSIPFSVAMLLSCAVLRLGRALGSSLGGSSSVGRRQALVVALLAVLDCPSASLPPSHQPLCPLTVHLANLSSISPRRSAAILLSSLRERRTARDAAAR